MHSACLLPRMLAVLTSAHQPWARVRERVGTQVWAWQSMGGRACVDMRGPTPGIQRTCDVACLHSCEGLGCAKHRPLSQLVGDLCARNRCVVQLWRTQVEHAQGYEARAHLDLFTWSA